MLFLHIYIWTFVSSQDTDKRMLCFIEHFHVCWAYIVLVIWEMELNFDLNSLPNMQP